MKARTLATLRVQEEKEREVSSSEQRKKDERVGDSTPNSLISRLNPDGSLNKLPSSLLEDEVGALGTADEEEEERASPSALSHANGPTVSLQADRLTRRER